MTKLKRKIKTVDSLLPNKKKKISIISILLIIILILIISIISYLIYKEITPYINATNIDKIVGKKTNITKCNTKDYIIINNDKSFTISITDENCNQKHYEGDVIIKNNEVIFNKKVKGIIDNDYNIIINNNLFESDKNE